MTLTDSRPTLADLGQPRMRGLLHVYACFVAVACGVVLVGLAATRPGAAPVVSTAVYSATVCALFAVSALYHRRVWSPRGYLMMRRLDHAMIFVFIAGTYTAFALVAFTGTARIVGLATVWAGAAFGIFLNLVWIDAPRWLTAVAYLGVGWVGLILIPQLFPALGVAAAVLVVVGGALYSVGAVTYASAWPNPFPATFGFHEIFHVLVIAAAVTQFVALSLVVL
jgi:hemolysin III